MTNSVDQISEQIFKIIKGFGHKIVLFTDDGKKTVDPMDARRFYAKDIQMMVNFVVDESTNELVVNLSKDTDINSVSSMLSSLRKLANRYIIEYTVKTFGKTIKPRDFAYQAKSQVKEDNTMKRVTQKEIIKKLHKGGYTLKLQDSDYDDRGYESRTYYRFNLVDPNGKIVGDATFDDYFGNLEINVPKYNFSYSLTNDRHDLVKQARELIDSDMTPNAEAHVKEGVTESMPAGVIKHKQRLANMTDQELATKLAGKSDNDLRQMAWRHGYGKMNSHYVNRISKTKNEENTMDVNEGFSGWHGSSRRSVNELGDAKIIVRHRRAVDEEKRGARTRQIQSIFIENSAGERFKFPSTNITAAKAMLRHVQEGGAPFDNFGQHIYGIMEELNQLKKFQRKNKRADFFEDAMIGEEIGTHIGNLRNNLKQMSGPKGYHKHFESFNSEKSEVSEEQINELKNNVTVSYFDESIADSLPYVARIIETMRTRQDKEAEIIDFAQYVMDNRDNIILTTPIDDTDPENPAARRFKDPATAFSAWVNYLAPKMKDDLLSNKMMQVSDTVFYIGSKYLNMAAAAIKVIKQRGKVAEAIDVDNKKESFAEEELNKIVESFDKYSVRKLFGV